MNLTLNQIIHPNGTTTERLYEGEDPVILDTARIIAGIRVDFKVDNIVPLSIEVLAARHIHEYYKNLQLKDVAATGAVPLVQGLSYAQDEQPNIQLKELPMIF